MRTFLSLLVVLFSMLYHAQQVDWLKSVNYVAITYAGGSSTDNAGNIYLSGPFGASSPGEGGYYIHKYSSNGNLIWKDTSGGHWATGATGVVTDNSDNAYLALYAAGNDTIKIGANYYPCSNNSYLVKYSSTGQLVWVKYGPFEPRDIAISPDGYIYVTGFGSGAVTYKYDQNGNTVQAMGAGSWWLTIDPLGNLHIPKAKLSSTGSVLFTHSLDGVSCGDENGNTYVSDAGFYCTSSLTKLNSSGQAVWSKSLSIAGNRSVFYDNGHVYVAGIHCDQTTSYGMRFYKYDTSGNEKWFVDISNISGNGEPPFVYKPNGKISAMGNSIYFSGYKSRSFPDGFLVKVTDNDITTGIKKNEPLELFSVVPNPTSGKVQIQFSENTKTVYEVRIINTFGKLIAHEKVNVSENLTKEIDLSQYGRGAYFVQIQPENNPQQKTTKKIVIE